MTGKTNWIDWPPQILGLGATGRIPVYIQSHAIKMAHERLSMELDTCALHYYLAESLRNPRVEIGRDGRILIELIVHKYKLGYFVAERLADRVLVKTFLLVTMRGAPEGDRLHNRLKMSRRDLEHLELDSLVRMMTSDLLKDEAVASIFRECGCEGLIECARRELVDEVFKGSADRFKAYFSNGSTPIFDAAIKECS